MDEKEWVFEITQKTVQEKNLGDYLTGLTTVRVHLERTRGNAPRRVEIVMEDGTYLWEVQDYKQVQGVWMPSQVVFRWLENMFVYTLERAEPTKGAIDISVPRGTRVGDWRALKRSALPRAMEAPFIRTLLEAEEGSADEAVSENPPQFMLTEWSPELLGSLWRTVSSGRR